MPAHNTQCPPSIFWLPDYRPVTVAGPLRFLPDCSAENSYSFLDKF